MYEKCTNALCDTYSNLGRARCDSVRSLPRQCVLRVSDVVDAFCQYESYHTSSLSTLLPSTTISHVSTSFLKLLTLLLFLIFQLQLTSYISVNRMLFLNCKLQVSKDNSTILQNCKQSLMSFNTVTAINLWCIKTSICISFHVNYKVAITTLSIQNWG